MPNDVFISYSRKDSEQALTLAEQLKAAGIGVWLDKHGIHGAEQWTSEIVEGIRTASTFMLLLSANSVASENVLRELSIATERNKRILPIEVSPTDLPAAFEYPLAGLQRVAITDLAAIVKAHRHGASRQIDKRKSLMVLPFEDLSPTQDNQWFADGLMSELITSLTAVKALRLIDEKTSRAMRDVKTRTVELAKELNVRYFLEGSVRKFGDQIKISMSLLDAEEGEHLWTDSHKGSFSDIFEIQEEVARKVVTCLELKLSQKERKELHAQETSSPEAYELFLRALEFYERQTSESLQHAISFTQAALELDPDFARALSFRAYAIVAWYRSYDRNSAWLEEAERLAQRALALRPDMTSAFSALSEVYFLRGDLKQAETTALACVNQQPDHPASYSALGFCYLASGKPELAIEPYMEAIRLNPEHRNSYWTLIHELARSGRRDEIEAWTVRALPVYERWLKFHPDDQSARVEYAGILGYAGRTEEAIAALSPVALARNLDGAIHYNIACLYCRLGLFDSAMEALTRSLEAGFVALDAYRQEEDLNPLRARPEFHALMEQLGERLSPSRPV